MEGPSRATLRLGSSSLGKASPRDGGEARFPTDLFILETVQFVRETAIQGTANNVRR